jgi:hypothetical protein
MQSLSPLAPASISPSEDFTDFSEKHLKKASEGFTQSLVVAGKKSGSVSTRTASVCTFISKCLFCLNVGMNERMSIGRNDRWLRDAYLVFLEAFLPHGRHSQCGLFWSGSNAELGPEFYFHFHFHDLPVQLSSSHE